MADAKDRARVIAEAHPCCGEGVRYEACQERNEHLASDIRAAMDEARREETFRLHVILEKCHAALDPEQHGALACEIETEFLTCACNTVRDVRGEGKS